MSHTNLHKTNLGWFVWFENTFNNYQMMSKSMTLIILVGFAVTIAAVMLTSFIGLFQTRLPLEFYSSFIGLSFKALFDEQAALLWSQSFAAIRSDLFRTFLFHIGFGITAGWWLFKKAKLKTEEMSETRFIKGTKLISEKTRVTDLNKRIEAGEIEARFSIGRIPLPFDSENKHTAIIAAIGGGKGVLLSKVMAVAGSDRTAKGIVHDIKPEWILSCYRPDRGDLIFNPMDIRSIKWTIWNDIHDIIDIENFVSWIIPNNPNAKDPFWDESARGILQSVMIYLWEKNDCTNEAIRRMMKLNSEELSEKLEGLVGAEYAAKKDSLSVFKSKMKWVDYLPDGDFSLRDWINSDKRGLIFLSNTEKTQALFKPLLTLFVNAFGSHVLNLPDNRNRRIFMFIDEFTALSRLEKVIDVIKLGRSKGVSLWIAFQDFQQLKKIYSDEDMRTVINGCKNIAVGQVNEPAAAKYLSERFGKQEFYEKSLTSSMGVADNRDGLSLNEQRKEDFVVKDSDLLNLEERQFFVKIDGLEGVTKTMADIQDIKEIAEGFIPVVMTKEEQLALMYANRNLAETKRKNGQELEEEKDEEQVSDLLFAEREDDGYDYY